MSSKVRVRVVAIAMGGVLAAASGRPAQAITDTIFEYSKAKTGHLMIPAGAFNATSSDAHWYNNGNYVYGTVATTTCFNAPANFPDGAKLTALGIWYTKANGTFFQVVLYRQYMKNGTVDTVVGGQPPSTNGARSGKAFTVTNASAQTVVNASYSYFLQVCTGGGSGDYLYGASISFTYTNAGD